jgi:hypothetical protein
MTTEHLFNERSHAVSTLFEVCDIRELSLWAGDNRVIDFAFKPPANLADTWVLPATAWVLPLSSRRVRLRAGTASELRGFCDMSVQDDSTQALRNRATIERFNAEYPQDKYPDSKIFPRDSRNASPTRKKDAKTLTAFWEYRELNKSTEPLQSNYGQADNDNFTEQDWVEEDLKKPERDAEAELETRPTPEEMAARYSVPTVQYEIRQVGLITGPRLSDCGYCMAPISPLIRAIKIPVSGDVECIGFRKTSMTECERAAHMSLAGLGIRRTQKQIGIYVDRILKPELLNIGDIDVSKKWTLYRIGDLYFAPHRTKKHRRGELTHYEIDGRKFKAKDQYGTPYGPKSKGSNDNVDSADERYAPPNDPEPSDDVVGRKSELAAVNARLSPQALLVANMVVWTDETETLAQTYADVGAALPNARANASERTLIRHGQRAVNDAAKEIGTLRQALAA